MKIISFILLIVFLVSCQGKQDDFSKPTEEKKSSEIDYVAQGKIIFEGVGNCTACHLADQKVIGPSLVDIAKAYKVSGANMIEFLKGNSEPIMDLGNYEIMKINLEITKKMNAEELKSLEAYLLSY